jgi:hypothetical protein
VVLELSLCSSNILTLYSVGIIENEQDTSGSQLKISKFEFSSTADVEEREFKSSTDAHD